MSGPTLADIAYQAGVSQATVSRVLNDKLGYLAPPGSVSSPPSTYWGINAPPISNPSLPAGGAHRS